MKEIVDITEKSNWDPCAVLDFISSFIAAVSVNIMKELYPIIQDIIRLCIRHGQTTSNILAELHLKITYFPYKHRKYQLENSKNIIFKLTFDKLWMTLYDITTKAGDSTSLAGSKNRENDAGKNREAGRTSWNLNEDVLNLAAKRPTKHRMTYLSKQDDTTKEKDK